MREALPHQRLPFPGQSPVEFAVHDPATPRVPSRRPLVDPGEEERVQRLARERIFASAHEHLSVRPADPADFLAYRLQGREVLPHGAMRDAGVRVVFDGGIASPVRARELWAWEDIIDEAGFRLADLAHHDDLVPVTSLRDVRERCGDGVVGVVLTLESASCIGGDIDRLDVLYGLGFRSLGLVYSESNRIGSGLSEERDGGLTHFGRDAVRRMNELGMIVDVAHASELTALDACETSTSPVIVSHAGARAQWDIPRNKSDDVIRAIAQSGGIVGISASPYSTASNAHPRHTLDSVMDHVEWCIEVAGIDHTALGFDTHFGDHLAWHRAWSVRDPRPKTHPIEYVDGAENPAEGTMNAARWLVARGYTDDEIAKICGENLWRVMKECWHQ